MLYALLCYGSEDELASLNAADEGVLLDRCRRAAQDLPTAIERGPALRLMPTSTALTLRPGAQVEMQDGPFQHTREQLLGLWLFDCAGLDDAMLAARQIAEARGANGALEIRPVADFFPASGGIELTLT